MEMEMGGGGGMLHLGKQGHSHVLLPSSSSLSQSQNAVPKGNGIPPTHPNHIHSQPSFFNFPPSSSSSSALSPSLLPPSPFSTDSFPPPTNSHRRSNSDIPFFNSLLQSSPSLAPPPSNSSSASGTEGLGDHRSLGEAGDDLFSAYINFDGVLNSSGTGTNDEKSGNETHEDLDGRASGTKTNCDTSDTEAESSINASVSRMHRTGLLSEKRDRTKGSAGGDIALASRHFRSVSMDSFMGKLNFADMPPKLPPPPGLRPGQVSPRKSLDTNSDAFSLEFGDSEFSGAEIKKIMANEKLAEMALTDPKRVKRILVNRQSAARAKERKMRYIQELEHKVQTLQTEATTLSVQLALLQRDSVGLTNQNNELKFRLQAMERQAQLRNALNEALNAEVQRLKFSTADIGGESHPSKGMEDAQMTANQQMCCQLQEQEKGNGATKTDGKP